MGVGTGTGFKVEVRVEAQAEPEISAYTRSMEAQKTPASDHALYNRRARKKPTNLSVNSDLLKKAHDLGIDLSATLEEALAVEVGMRQRELWLEENREAIQAYNEHVAQHGVFSTGRRGF